MRTPLCQRLGIEVPIIQARGGESRPDARSALVIV
jgi:hypothetical protein